MDYDEDEAIKKAMALSMETAKEDEKRRKDKYGGKSARQTSTPSPTLGNQAKKAESGTGTSIISRPRPQARVISGVGNKGAAPFEATGIGTAAPVIPPRPDGRTLKDAKQSHAHLHTQPAAEKRRSGTPPQRPPPPSRTPPPPSSTDPPLITLSPSPKAARTDSQLFDFDLESLDPLHNPGKDPRGDPRGGKDVTHLPRSTSAEFNSRGKPTAVPLGLNSAWPSSDATHSHTDPTWAAFDPAKPARPPTVPPNPFLGQPMGMQPASAGFQNHFVRAVSGTPSGAVNRTGRETAGFTATHSEKDTLSHPSSQTRQSVGTNPHLAAPLLARTPSDSSLHQSSSTNHAARPHIDRVANTGLPRVPSQPDMQRAHRNAASNSKVHSNTASNNKVNSNTVSNSKTQDNAASNSKDKTAQKGLPSNQHTLPSNHTADGASVSLPGDGCDGSETNDLMDFPEASGSGEEFLSLESFDPLYNLSETYDSSGLFTDPCDKFKRHSTQNPFPMVNALSTRKLLEHTAGGERQEVAKHYNAIDVDALQADMQATDNAAADTPGHKRSESSGSTELLDPFCVSDLMVSLEKKRRKHAADQERRKALLREGRPGDETKDNTPQKNTDNPSVETSDAPGGNKVKRLSRTMSHIAKGRESTYECLQKYNEAAQDEVKAFCEMVGWIKLQYPHDHPSNTGIVVSPRTDYPAYVHITVKVKVTARFMKEPLTFTPSLEVTVQHAIAEVLLSITEDLLSTSAEDYMLKVFGKAEYLLSESQLGDYCYVQSCLQLDEDIRLVLVDISSMQRPLLRTALDDRQAVLVPKHRDSEAEAAKINRDSLNILMETFYGEVERLRDAAIQGGGCRRGIQCKGVVQSVKALCAVLYKMETIDVIRAIQRLYSVTMETGLKMTSPKNKDAFQYVTDDGEIQIPVEDADRETITNLDDLHIALEEVTKAVKGQIDLFCRTFNTDFRFESATSNVKDQQEISHLDETLLLHVATAHRVPLKWKTMFESFRLVCGIYYGGGKLCEDMETKVRPSVATGLQDTYVWDEWLHFESLSLSRLPRETRLCVQLVGVKATQSGDSTLHVSHNLGWSAMQMFNHKFELVQGSHLVGFWSNENLNSVGTTMSPTEFTQCVLLQLNLPDFDCDYVFPAALEPLKGLQQDFSSLHGNEQGQLKSICAKTSHLRISAQVRTYLWDKRHFLYQEPQALPKVLQSVPCWDHRSLREIYTLVSDWEQMTPTQALELLLPRFPDTFVRAKAVEWISVLTDDQLLDLLPQLIQGLKFECYHTSALAKLLIERSITSPRIAHEFYWLLKEAADDVHFRKRYQLMFGALLSVVGEAGRRQFGKQEDLVKMLAAIAEKVKAAKDKENVLHREVYNMWEFFEHKTVSLPLSPAIEVCGLDTQSCSYFSSNAFPLKLVFKNVDPKAESIYTMFKSGDDLRQDMLTMQVVRIMDRLWRKEQLDLKIITFKCQATGVRRGLVELVTESDTLRKIQVKHGKGVAGSFKDTTIREWLQVQNPTELEYQKAVDNFIASCAGYCVATYVLGICDRHNDNIMVKQSGHLFHIDFGKFLGDSQMFGNIKRDRTPFVLTSDMAYVINGGDKPGHKFQHFVDLCCSAFNILRKHASFFINLFSMMVQSHIPGVNEQATKYVERALLPDHSDTEAIAIFTRMIEECLKSTFTQWNFFIHNLAQMKFSGHTEGALLSFIPKTYSINTDGKIAHVEVFGYQKRYNPEKYYIYIVKVQRENQNVASCIFRRFSEFQELLHKLACQFPLVRLPTLSNKVILGRTHVKSVAEERKLELELCLRDLLTLSPEIAEHDLVYTFFHPMLRDEQDIDKTNLQKLRERPAPKPQSRNIDGQIKLAMFHKNGEFTVMVMHVKDLVGGAGEPPDAYVKLYLLPDPFKETKQKTKIVRGTFHPTFNEMLTYHMPLEELTTRTLSASVWSYDALSENEYLGSSLIKLAEVDLTKDTPRWYRLQSRPALLS